MVFSKWRACDILREYVDDKTLVMDEAIRQAAKNGKHYIEIDWDCDIRAIYMVKGFRVAKNGDKLLISWVD